MSEARINLETRKWCWEAREERDGSWTLALWVGNKRFPLRGARFLDDADCRLATGYKKPPVFTKADR